MNPAVAEDSGRTWDGARGWLGLSARGTEDEGKLFSVVRVVRTHQARGKVVDDKNPARQKTLVAQQ